MPILKPATLEEAKSLSLNLRPEDEAEVRALTGKLPEEVFVNGIHYSDVPVSIIDERDGCVVGMFGVVTVQQSPRVGAIWMLASPKLLKHRFQFIRESRQWVEALQAHYDILGNVVDERNLVHIRWLQWCGFHFINHHPKYGYEQRPFLEFVRISV